MVNTDREPDVLVQSSFRKLKGVSMESHPRKYRHYVILEKKIVPIPMFHNCKSLRK